MRLIDPDLSRAQAAAFSLREHFPEMPVETMALPPAVDDSATAITATDSRHALLHPATCKASLVVSLGADADCQSELDPAWVGAAALFVDHVDSALLGDLNRWRTMGLIGGDPLPDLPALLARKAVTSALRRVFVSTGSALLDNLTVHYLLEHLGGASDAPSHSG